MLRVGHRGAAALAPQNTIASMRAAVEVGVDMLEFDVCPGGVVAHDIGHPGPPLAGFLEQLSDVLPAEVGLLVDLKGTGHELEVVRCCAAAGLLDRCLFCTLELKSIELLAPDVRTSFSYSRRAPGPRLGTFRRRAAQLYLRSGATDATIRHTLIDHRLVETVHGRGGRLFAWTVNDAARIAELRDLGVDGVITDDPRLLNPKEPHARQPTR